MPPVRGSPPLAPRQPPPPTEDVVQAAIVATLRVLGCDVFVHRGTTLGRHEGPAPGYGRGWPDLLICDLAGGAPFLAEVKRDEKTKPRPDQEDMHKRLRLGGFQVYVWWDAQQAADDVMERRRR